MHEDRVSAWTDLFRHWVDRDMENVVADLAGFTKEDADALLLDLLGLARLVVECKEVL